MIKIEKIEKNYVVKSDNYTAVINNSGTIKRLLFNCIDTGLKRDGCEYWIEGGVHFEQEWGSTLNVIQSENEIKIKATLASPGNKKKGGECTTKYLFKNNSIVIESVVLPIFNMVSCDKYVCFNPNEYTCFSFDGEQFNPINKYSFVDSDTKKIILKNDKKAILINCLSSISAMRIYKTKSMVEVKPLWDNPLMEIEYKIYER